MFGLFKTPIVHDPELGELRREHGAWRGTLRVGAAPVPLILPGPKSGPEPDALALVRQLATRVDGWKPQIAAALFEHYEPYADSAEHGDDDTPATVVPRLTSADGVWPHASLLFVQTAPLDGVLTIELGYRVDWDEEHTLGARFQGDRLVELCGSVVEP